MVFGQYKSFLQAELHRFARQKNVLTASDVAGCIRKAYCKAIVPRTISDRFLKCGMWDPQKRGKNIDAPSRLFQAKTSLTIDTLVASFKRQSRTLLRDADVDEEGNIRIKTTSGTHLTSVAVLEAFHKREMTRKATADKKRIKTAEEGPEDVREAPRSIRWYAELSDRCREQRKQLRAPRVIAASSPSEQNCRESELWNGCADDRCFCSVRGP